MKNTIIIYESRYGFTQEISNILCKVLGPANLCKTREFKKSYKEFDMVVMCTPVYIESFDKKIFDFIEDNKEWLKKKKVVLLYSCLSKNGVEKEVEKIRDILGGSLILVEPVLGRLQLDKLNSHDEDAMKKFSNKIGMPLKSYDLFDKEKFIELVLQIKKIKDKNEFDVDINKTKKYVEKFINSHNTCCLCTGFNKRVRCTNIEYSYIDNNIYFISEGGEKFANIFLNDKVSIGIFDSYKSMDNLAGMEISGVAYEVPIGSDEYKRVFKYKTIDYEKIIKLQIKMNVVRISIDTVEFLWSDFKKIGYDIKQIVEYNFSCEK